MRTDAAGLPGDGMPPEPGDLFVLAATADLPVEWAILDRRPGELLAVPADNRSLAGSADVEVPAELSGGPLSLRCRFGVWLDAGLFEPDLRSGALTPNIVAEALHRFRRLESGGLEASPLAEEVDADPEYADWIREVPERARPLAAAARSVPWPAARPLRPSPGPRRTGWRRSSRSWPSGSRSGWPCCAARSASSRRRSSIFPPTRSCWERGAGELGPGDPSRGEPRPAPARGGCRDRSAGRPLRDRRRRGQGRMARPPSASDSGGRVPASRYRAAAFPTAFIASELSPMRVGLPSPRRP